MSAPVAKINQKKVIRLAVFLLCIALLIFVYQQVVVGRRNADPGLFDSTGYMAASMETGDGQQAVLITPDGTITPSPGYKAGMMDSPPIFAKTKDGTRLFFASDREDDQSHVFRWNPAQNIVERRTLDKRTKSGICFTVPGDDSNLTALVISGGTVLELDPHDGKSKQVLPPRSLRADGTSENGAKGQFDELYASIGSSFKIARWSKEKQYIIAVLRRDAGEILIAQNMTDMSKPPIIVGAAEHVDFDFNPVTGDVIFTLQGFQFPDPEHIPEAYVKNGKVNLPFKNMLGIYTPGDAQPKAPVALGQDNTMKDGKMVSEDNVCFGQPRVSPDGSTIFVIVGTLKAATAFEPKGAVLMAAESGGSQKSKTILKDPVYDPTWDPTGKLLAFTADVNGKRAILTINVETGERKNVTGDKGNFHGPVFGIDHK